jgi:hypothetical protein
MKRGFLEIQLKRAARIQANYYFLLLQEKNQRIKYR